MTQRSAFLFAIAVSIAFLISGEGLKYIASENRSRQTHYIDKIRLHIPSSFSLSNIRDPNVRFLAENKFFKERLSEDGVMQELKVLIPSIQDSYFKSVWDMFRYLEFINDIDGIYKAIDRLVTSGHFRNNEKCFDGPACQIVSATSNINADDGRRLFTIINDNFVSPAIEAYEELAFATAHDLATSAMILTRKVDFDPAVSPRNYDRVLVIATFLSQPNALKGRYSPKDLSSLVNYLDKGILRDDGSLSPEISAYMIGMRQLRSECFEAAASMFYDLATTLKSGPSADLFYFLSVRATARPFLVPKGIQSVDGRLQVKDCGDMQAMEDIQARFRLRFEQARNAVQHKGLRSDMDFYQTQNPANEERRSEIDQYLLVAKQRKMDEAAKPAAGAALSGAAEAPVEDAAEKITTPQPVD